MFINNNRYEQIFLKFIITVNNKDYFLGTVPGIHQKEQNTLYDTSIKLETSSRYFKNYQLVALPRDNQQNRGRNLLTKSY